MGQDQVSGGVSALLSTPHSSQNFLSLIFIQLKHAPLCTNNLYLHLNKIAKRKIAWLFKEWVSFFPGSWGMNRSAGQTNRVNREAVLRWFVCSALRFIPHEPRKKTLIPYIYNVSNKDSFYNSPRKVINSKSPQ